MKILFIIDSLRSGGKERRLVALIKGLLSYKDVEMELISLSKEIHYKEILDTKIKIYFLKRDIRKDIRIFSKFNRILKAFQPDLVHGWDNIAAIHFAPICKLKNIPYINSMITAAPQTHKLTKRYLSHVISYPFSDVILSNSQAGLDALFVPVNKQKVIYNGFDFDRLLHLEDKESVLKKFSINSNKPIVGMVASFNAHKDYETLIETASLLKDEIYFITVGDGENLNKVKEKAKQRNLKNIYFLGRQSDVESIVNVFDIGVLLSNPNVHGEGISNAIMEYMALQKPVVVSRGGGTAELVVDGETGFIIDPKDSYKLAEKIMYLIKNRSKTLKMGEEGRNRIEIFFSIEKMVTETYQLYRSILDKKYKRI